MSLEPIKNLNGIGRGVDKRWIYRDSLQKELAHDYLQKINYSIQDINSLLKPSRRIEKRTDIVSLVVMIDWIADSVYRYKDCLLEELMSSFANPCKDELVELRNYLKAMRSLIVAHPLHTSQHQKWGLDGDIICVDLRVDPPFLFESMISNVRRLGVDGIGPYEHRHDDDIYLYVYSKKSNAQFFEFLIVDFVDVLCVAHAYINQLYELDRYLSKQRKKDYAVK